MRRIILTICCTMIAGLGAYAVPALASGLCGNNYDIAHACSVTFAPPGSPQYAQYYDSGTLDPGGSAFYTFHVPSNANTFTTGISPQIRVYSTTSPEVSYSGGCIKGGTAVTPYLQQRLYNSTGTLLTSQPAQSCSGGPTFTWNVQLGATYYFEAQSTASTPVGYTVDLDGRDIQVLPVTPNGPTPAHGTVPYVKRGWRVSTAKSRLRSHHLTIGQLRYRHNHHTPRGRFVKFVPGSGTRLPVGSRVDIVVSLGK